MGCLPCAAYFRPRRLCGEILTAAFVHSWCIYTLPPYASSVCSDLVVNAAVLIQIIPSEMRIFHCRHAFASLFGMAMVVGALILDPEVMWDSLA